MEAPSSGDASPLIGASKKKQAKTDQQKKKEPAEGFQMFTGQQFKRRSSSATRSAKMVNIAGMDKGQVAWESQVQPAKLDRSAPKGLQPRSSQAGIATRDSAQTLPYLAMGKKQPAKNSSKRSRSQIKKA